jgi:hypothetical protein
VSFESLLPSVFRFRSAFAANGIRQVASGLEAIAVSDHRPLRASAAEYFREFLRGEEPQSWMRMLAQLGAIPVAGPDSQVDPRSPNCMPALLRLISVCQHYELPSTMVDFTWSWDSALWFATHHWRGDPATEGEGVVYRVDIGRLNRLVEAFFAPGTYHYRERVLNGIIGCADIAHGDPALGLRPLRQSGLSLFGLENSFVYLMMTMEEAWSAFVFPLDVQSSTATTKRRIDHCPEESEDPTLNVFKAAAGRISDFDFDFVAAFLATEGFSADELMRLWTAWGYGLL